MPLVPKIDDKNRGAVTTSPFSINTDYLVKATGYSGVAAAGTTTNVDFAIGAEDRYINGVHLFLKNHAWTDSIQAFQVVDKDAVYSPAGTVLSQFVYTWNVNDQVQDQGQSAFSYVARIPAGVYIRIIYVSTGLLDVGVKLNCLLHKKVT